MADVKKIITAAILESVKEAAAAPSNDLKASDVAKVASAIAKDVAPIAVNAANQEPWYQSRVTLGALASILLPLLGLIGVTSDVISADDLTTLLMALVSAGGGLLALYGRWKAKKPIGE